MERLLVINSEWPEEANPVQAATLVHFELLRELANRSGIHVGFLKVGINEDVNSRNEMQEDAKQKLEALGITYLEPFLLPPLTRRRSKVVRLLFPKLRDYYTITVHRAAAYAAAQPFRPTCLMIQWCEKETHLYSEFPAKKFAYYGNSDALIERIWEEYMAQFGDNVVRKILREIRLARLEKYHLREMDKWDFISCVGLNFANYYKQKLGDKSFYLNNIWLNRYEGSWQSRREEMERSDKLRIVGNIGSLAASANTMGLEILARDLLPELRKVLPVGSFEINIYGRGKPLPHIAQLLDQSEINVCGFVENLDSEMFASQIFLCLNNGSAYKTGHTRYLHAWSLGSCVIAHQHASLSMPEIRHGENALLGGNTKEIAELIARASADKSLRRSLGNNGYKTLESEFRVDFVVNTILEKLTSI